MRPFRNFKFTNTISTWVIFFKKKKKNVLVCFAKYTTPMSSNKNKAQIPNKETFSRMNFLYQASMLMAKRNRVLGSYYGQQCQSIGKKAQLRISPDLKRDLCKRCALAQRPGITTDLKISQTKKRRRRSNKESVQENIDDQAEVIMTCQLCSYSRRFRINPDYTFWLENPASITEEIVYDGIDVAEKRDVPNTGKIATS